MDKATIKGWMQNLALVVFSLIVFFIFLEAYFVFLNPQSDFFLQPDERVGYIHIPNMEGKVTSDDFSVNVKINSKGWRDQEHSYEKSPDTFRIVVLGDSYVEAYQVPFEETFIHILEERLNSNNKKEFDVVSLGVGGFGTDQEYLTLKHYGVEYKPDLVILAFVTGNDVADNYFDVELSHKPYFIFNSSGELEEMPFKVFDDTHPVRVFLKKYFHNTYRFLRDRIRNVNALMRFLSDTGFANKQEMGPGTGEIPLAYNVYSAQYSSDWQDAWNITKALILKTKEESEFNNAKFILVYLTNREQVHSEYWQKIFETYPEMGNGEWDIEKPNKILEDFSMENNITYIQLLPYFKKYANETGWMLHHPHEGHWNSNGHRLAAEIIYNQLIENQLIPAS